MATSYIKSENKGKVSVTADGISSYATLLNTLFGQIILSLVTPNSKIIINGRTVFGLYYITSSELEYSFTTIQNSAYSQTQKIKLQNNSCTYGEFSNSSYISHSATVPNTGTTITFCY